MDERSEAKSAKRNFAPKIKTRVILLLASFRSAIFNEIKDDN